MKIIKVTILLAGLHALLLSPIYAEGFIQKEVYSFKDKNGSIVFTDRRPKKSKTYKTQTIESARSTSNTQNVYSENTDNKSYSKQNNDLNLNQTINVIVENSETAKKKHKKKAKKSQRRCKSYKRKLTYYSDKMKSGYKSSEYKRLEASRKKYRKLLFNNCDTKTFND